MEMREITDKKIWEKFINQYSPQSLFQSWNWGEVVIEVNNQKSEIRNLWRLGIYDGNELIGIAQVEKVSAKKGTFLHIRHGPIFTVWTKKYFMFLLNYLYKLSKIQKVIFIRISPLIENTKEFERFFHEFKFRDAPIHRMDGEVCWVLDLDKDDNTLLGQMRKTTRYLIKQAQKMGVKILKSTDPKDLDDFLDLYKQTAKRQKFIMHKGIREEFKIFLKDNQVILIKGFYENRMLACALILFYNNQAIYHHSASIEQKIPVNYLLQMEAIKEAISRNKKIYNFWGIAPDKAVRHPWVGLSRFKKGFGGKTIEYLHAKDLPLSYLYCTTYITESIRRILKGY